MADSSSIPPGSIIGILGGGQLGQMLSIAAGRMGYKTHIYTPEKDSPASQVATTTTIAAFENTATLKKFASSVEVITYEFENIPVAPLKAIADKIRPGLHVLETCQHRIKEKELVNKLGIKTAPFAAVRNESDLKTAIKKIGLPSVLKTATMGYDGKGQWKLKSERDVPELAAGSEYILEGFVDFTMEISVIVARAGNGDMQCFVPVENRHKNHILDWTIAPAAISEALAKKAESMAETIAQGLNLVGILAIEMFITKDSDLLVNELAPRPHNSGHWTIDACKTSQFEQVVRAIGGLPLGSTQMLCPAKMLNLIGDDIKEIEKYRTIDNARVHIYGKKESRPGRKMGHVTFLERLGPTTS